MIISTDGNKVTVMMSIVNMRILILKASDGKVP